MSHRHVDLKTVCAHWTSIFNTHKKISSLVIHEDRCHERTMTHRDLRLLPETHPGHQDRTWDPAPIINHHYDVAVMEGELSRLSHGVPTTGLIPIVSSTIPGDNGNRHVPVHEQWLQVVLLPTDWLRAEQRELEIRWIEGSDYQIRGRFRRKDTPRILDLQMPFEYWGGWDLSSFEVLLTTDGPRSVRIVKCYAEAHVRDEQGVAASDTCLPGSQIVVGQLESGIVLWWLKLPYGGLSSQITQEGDYVRINGKLVHVLTGED